MSTPVGNFESYPPPLSTVPSSAIEMEATRIWSNYYSGFKWMWWLLFIMILTALIISIVALFYPKSTSTSTVTNNYKEKTVTQAAKGSKPVDGDVNIGDSLQATITFTDLEGLEESTFKLIGSKITPNSIITFFNHNFIYGSTWDYGMGTVFLSAIDVKEGEAMISIILGTDVLFTKDSTGKAAVLISNCSATCSG